MVHIMLRFTYDSQQYYIYILFSVEPCTEDEVRLNDGVVQVCHDGQWGLVCSSPDISFQAAAVVVCNLIGTPSEGKSVLLA